jgi:hypothetical protein
MLNECSSFPRKEMVQLSIRNLAQPKSDHEWEIELTGVLAVFAVAACVADLRERFRRVLFAKMRG